ncbi:MAG: aminotransferase class I/II-fold pyridoxal phosphate-dependent enzyme [Deltaproteobacteria bacterium]
MLARIAKAKELEVFPFFRPFENVGPRVRVHGGSYLNFMSNDYLGLSQHPDVIAAAVEGVKKYGTGLGSARPQATSVRHNELERRLAAWTSYDACAVFTTGYQSLVGTLQAFLDDSTTVILDKLSHASIIDGVLLAQGGAPDMEVRFFRHNNVEHLTQILESCEHEKKMVVIEGLYSVDGDMAPVKRMLEVAKKHNAVLVLDDAHGLGALGATGRGVLELEGIIAQADILIGTFSKSFGTTGGFVCADQNIIDYLKLTARAFCFSASLPLAQVEAAIAALNIIEKDYSLMRKLEENGAYFRKGLHSLGFDLGESSTHITPIFLNEEELTMKFAAYLFHGAGVMMMPFISPGVLKGKERLRCNVTAVHSKADMAYTLEALAEIGHRLGVVPQHRTTGASRFEQAYRLAQHKLGGLRNAGLPYVWHELTAGKRNAELERKAAAAKKS